MPSDSAHPSAIWDTVLTAARLHCDASVFEDLVAMARLEDYDPRSESAVIQIPEDISRHDFKTRALPAISKAFGNAVGISPRIFIESAEIDPKSMPVRSGPKVPSLSAPVVSQPVMPMTDSLRLNPRYTFENFVVGPSNRLAHAAAKAVVDGPGTTYNPLFLHGSVGLGKTHLLQAICHEILRRDPSTRMRYLSCEQFVNGYVEALGAGRQTEFRRNFRDIDLIVVDDIHFLASKEATQEEFFHTFNDLHTAGKQIVISSDSPPREIPSLEERLVSRFLWGLPVKLETPCNETRCSIVRAKAEERQIDMPKEVVEFVADAVRSNIRELEGAVTQVVAMAAMLGRPISLPVAREALKDLVSINNSKRITIDDICEVTCRIYGVRMADLQSQRRTRSVTLPRQVAMYLAKKLTQKTLSEIGGHFGGRDHTTVLHSIRKIEDESSRLPELEERLSSLEEELTRLL